MAPFKSGFISILGRPNVGKSTLFNRLLGDKIAIVAEKPQTTRNRILGIKNTEGGQLIFLDTPGIHQGRSELNERMVRTAIASGRDADILLFLIEATSPLIEKDQKVMESLRGSSGVPILVINKIDLVKRKNLLPLMDQYQKLHPFQEILPVSALTGEGIDILLDEMMEVLPESPPYYSEDIITDQTERFWVSEIIREKVIRQSYQEIPYSTAVTIEEFKEHPEKNLVVIKATIHVERDSQKKILIGKGGQKLKKIGEDARKEAEAFWGTRLFLELWVNVEKNWTQDPRVLTRLGYPSTLNHSA
ncbi:MAG: GTPase Era [Deltaproteobacteria bacterium RBG_16_48_10]|nr:MAG: GTPase Era [Deltaproteobacteria bacterium RBG_16_48_10]